MDDRASRHPGREGSATAVEYSVNRFALDEHEEDSCAVREHVSRLPSHIRTGRSKTLSLGRCAVPDQEPRTGLDECQRHRLTHRTQANETDRIGCVHPVPPRCCWVSPPLREIFLGQWHSGGLGLHHDARHSPAAGFFDRFNAVDAPRHLLAVAVQPVAAP